MGMKEAARRWLGIDSKAALPNPSDPTEGVFVAAQVRQTEDQASRGRNWNQSQYLAQFAHSLALDAAMFNAKCLASVPLRLYRLGGHGRKVGKDRLAHLRNPATAGRKAATMADTGSEVVEVDQSDALDVLRHPEMGETAMAWEVKRWMDKQWYGEALMLKDPEGPWLPLLMPQYADVQPDRDNLISGWWYGRDSYNRAEFQAEDVIQMKWAKHTSNPYRGMGWAELCLQEIGIDKAMLDAEADRWKKGGYPKAHLALENGKNQQQIDEARKKIHQQMRDNVSVLVTSEGKLAPFALPKDMTFDSSAEVIERRILNRAGIPVTLYRMQDANRAAAASIDPVYSRYTLAPALAIDAEQWTELLLPWFDLDPGEYFFAYDEVSSVDRDALRADISAFVGTVWTPNEARAELGYDPLPEPSADRLQTGVPVLPVPTSGITIPPSLQPRKPDATPEATPATPDAAAATGEVAQTALNGAQVQALQGLAGSVAAGQLPADAARAIAEAAFPLVSSDILDRIFGSLGGFTPAAPEGEPMPPAKDVPRGTLTLIGKAWADSDRYFYDDGHGHHLETKAAETDAEAAIRKVVEAWLRAVAANVTISSISGGGPSLASMQADLAAALEPIIGDVFRAGASTGYAQIGMDDTDLFELVPQDALDALARHNSLLIEQITGTTEEGIRRAIQTGLEEGLSARETQSQVQAAVSDAAPWRSEAIARTETANAQGAGQTAAWRQAGIATRSWLLAPDACPICIAMVENIGRVGRESKAVPIDEPFARAGVPITGSDGRTYTPAVDVYHEPLHPNDRCTTIAIVEGAQ